jgi:prolyl oligopeptidase
LVTCLFLLAIAASSHAVEKTPAVQPRASIRVEQTNLGEIKIVDSYRWMEDADSPEFAAWVKGQDDYTRAVLEANTQREQITKRIVELAHNQDEVSDVKRRSGGLFYLRRPANGDRYRLMVRGKDGAERVLLDPAAFPEANAGIDFYEPSPDARYVAVGVSANGSDEPLLRVVEVRSGKLLGESIARTHNAFPRWRSDGDAFYYLRRPPLAQGAPPATRGHKARSYLHVVGSDSAKDPAVFGYEVSPRIPVGITDSTYVVPVSGSPYALALQYLGAKSNRIVYYAPLSGVIDGNTPWQKLSDVDDGIDDLSVRGHDVYLLTHKGAPRGKVLRVSLDNPSIAHAEEVVPPGTAVILEVAVASDALYVRLLDGGVGQILRVPFDGRPAARLHLPFDGAVSQLDRPQVGASE